MSLLNDYYRNVYLGSCMKQLLLWTGMSLPGAMIIAQYTSGISTYGIVLHESGQWSAIFLVLTLFVSPLRQFLNNRRGLENAQPHPYVDFLVAQRRSLGVASFAYAALHTGLYVEYKWGANLILTEGLRMELATGWIAFTILVVLALTSNSFSTRRIRTLWRRLHRGVYLVVWLLLLHWWLTSVNYSGLLIWIMFVIASQLFKYVLKTRSSSLTG